MPAIDRVAEIDVQLAGLDGQMAAILDAANADSGGRLTDEQRTQYDAHSLAYDALLAEKEQFVADAKRHADLEARKLRSKVADEKLAAGIGRRTADVINVKEKK